MQRRGRQRRSDEEKRQLVASLRMIDDVMFEEVIADPSVCEEILQVVLENPMLRIKPETVVAQKSIRNLQGRSVRLDAYVEGQDEVFNIEIQRSNNCNHFKRVRYNASCITAHNSEQGDTFEDIQELYVIYISEFDLFKDGLTIYHGCSTVKETGKIIDNGLHEIYINTQNDDGSKIARLMKHFMEPDFSDEEFPSVSRRIKSLKHDRKEVEHMCKAIDAYAKKESIYAVIEALDNCNMDEQAIIVAIIQQFDLDVKLAKQYYDDVFRD